jgi:hypothetical protein
VLRWGVRGCRVLRAATAPRFSLVDIGGWIAALNIVVIPVWWWPWRIAAAAAEIVVVTLLGSVGSGFAAGYLSAAAWRPAARGRTGGE